MSFRSATEKSLPLIVTGYMVKIPAEWLAGTVLVEYISILAVLFRT